MSDGNPFARTSSEEGDGWPVVVGAVVFYCGSRSAAQDYATSINAAGAAREREAAANALREAATRFVGHRSGEDEWTADDVRAWLRSQADTIHDAVIDRCREAAAKALEDAAEMIVEDTDIASCSGYEGGDDGRRTLGNAANLLRSRAAAIRKGES